MSSRVIISSWGTAEQVWNRKCQMWTCKACTEKYGERWATHQACKEHSTPLPFSSDGDEFGTCN